MFEDREEAGLRLCPKLKVYSSKKGVFLVGLTRGGVVTAKVISNLTGLKLKALVVKKIGAPGNEELALGAIASSKDIYWNKRLLKELKLSKKEKDYLVLQKKKEINLSEKEFGIKLSKHEFSGKTVILVDDGVATGASVMAACMFLKRNKAKKIILATPVIASDTLSNINSYFDGVIYLEKRINFYAVGEFYRNFPQVENVEVRQILTSSN